MPEETFDRRDVVRSLGGVLFALGAIVLLEVKGFEFSPFARFLTILVPVVVLWGAAFAAGRPAGRLQSWQTVMLTFATLLTPVALLLFVQVVKGRVGADLNIAWTFALTGAIAVFASLRLGALYQLLLAAIAFAVAWVALWDKILDGPSANTLRWLLLALALIYVVAALAMREGNPEGHGELITGAGVVFVIVGFFALAALAALFTSRLGTSLGPFSRIAKPSEFWNVVLLLGGVGLIVYGARLGRRGPGYAGAIVLFIFVIVVATKDRDKVGWPLLLLFGGGGTLLLGFLMPPTSDAGVRAPAVPPPPPDTAAVAGGPGDAGDATRVQDQPPPPPAAPPPSG